MAEALLYLTPYATVGLFLMAGLMARRVADETAPNLVEWSAAGALASAVTGGAAVLAGAEAQGAHLLRLDPLAAIMMTLISFVGVIVLRYSRNYLGGDRERGAFLGGLCMTLASVSALVTAGDVIVLALAWIATSLTLHKLLLFRGERPGAILAARKKFIAARVGDACLLGAIGILIGAFGTTSIDSILAGAEGGAPTTYTGFAAALLAVAAALKSAQFPTHGWLTEVMETPTPVSALLHAGVVNAGGFLLIRFADVMLLNMPAMHLVAIVGGFTALFGGFVMLSQTSIKVSLAYSTVAQMGFMLLQCGLGAFTAATLHLVAHSLYKAHAFLASGRAVTAAVSAGKARGPVPVPQALLALGIAVAVYSGVSLAFGSALVKSPAIVGLGVIFIAGITVYLTQTLASRDVLLRGVAVSAAAAVAYFALQAGMAALLDPVVPMAGTPDAIDKAILGLAVGSFIFAAFAQITDWKGGETLRQHAYVHLSRGLYANTLFNRLIGALRIAR